jgi:hypothetical protein
VDLLVIAPAVPGKGTSWITEGHSAYQRVLPPGGLFPSEPPSVFAGLVYAVTAFQKENLRANCRTRGSPAAVIVPKAAVPATVLGAPRGGAFVRLKASARKSSLIDS